MKKHNTEPKKNITAPAIFFLGLLATYYFIFTNNLLTEASYSSSNNETYENNETSKTYTWTLQDNQILDITLDTTNNHYIEGDSIYKGDTKLCSFGASHVANYRQAYEDAVTNGLVETGYLSGGEYVLSSYPNYRGTTYYYLISLNNFYYTVTLSSDISLETVRECYNKITFKINKTA